MDKPESFEITDYGADDEVNERVSVIGQIVKEKASESPAWSILVSFEGQNMVLKYHCFEMKLPSRVREVHDNAEAMLRETLSHVKKEFKKRTKKVLTAKEIKERAGHTVQKVSLNERYYVIFWKTFEIG